jgi:uncharacterized LabA/DUF88 family protein
MFVNDSNIQIEAKKLQSKQKMLKTSEDHRVRMDMGKLANVLAKGRPIRQGTLYGSEPPSIDSVWEKIREQGWKVNVTQSTAKRGQLSTKIVVDVVSIAEKTPPEERSSIILVTGDASMIPAIEKVVEIEGWNVEVYMWSHATSEQLQRLQQKHKNRVSVSSLDPHLNDIMFTNMKFNYSKKNVKKSSGPVISTVDGMRQLIEKMEMNKIVRKQYQSKVKELNKLLSKIHSQLSEYPKTQKATKIILELKIIEEALRQALNECDELSKSMTHSHQDNAELQPTNLESLDRSLNKAETSAEAAIELIQSMREPIYQNPSGGECLLVVAEVVAEPDGQCLSISWKDCKENANQEVTEYEVLLKSTSDTDFEISSTCETRELRITEVKPWEQYSVRVRAINEVGCGPWSEPEVIVIMNQSPPTQPQLKDISYDATDCNSLCIKITRNELQNKQQVTHCIIEQSTTNESSCYLFPDSNEMLNMVMRIPPGYDQYKYRIKFVNQWGESIPTEELEACAIIPSLIAGKPHEVRSIDAAKTSTDVWKTWKQPKRNTSAVRRDIVEKRQLGSPWEEAPPETSMDPLESQLRDLNNRPPEYGNELYRQSATQKVGYQVVKNLKQDTPHEFRSSRREMANSPEYNSMVDCIPGLRLAVQPNIISLSGELLRARLINKDKETWLRNTSISEVDRAAELVSLVTNKVREDPENYHELVAILKKDERQYETALAKLDSKYKECKGVAKKSSEVSGLVISTVQGMFRLITKMEMNNTVQKQYQSKFKQLHKLLSEIQSQLTKHPKIQKATKIIVQLKNVEEALQQATNKCDELSKTRMHSHQDNTKLQPRSLESLLEQAETSVKDAIELIQSMNQCPLVVTKVVAEPDGQFLNISWKDCKENANREVTKYDILLKSTSDTDFKISFTCEKCQLRITEEVKPREQYSVQVRAVNEVGYGPWSEPEVIGPPTQPQLKDVHVSYDAIDNNSLCIKVTLNELQIKQQVTHCIVEQSTTNESSCYIPDANKVFKNMVIKIPPGCDQCRYRIKFKNQWGESIPTEELDACTIIPSLIPGKPRKVCSIDAAKTTTEVWITWKQPKRNAGAVRRYMVENRQLGSPWEEVSSKTSKDYLERQLRDLKNHPPEFVSQLHHQFAAQNEDQICHRVGINLKQDTPYEFRIFAVNEKGRTGPPSTTLHVKTEPNKTAKMIDIAIELLRHFLNNYPKSPLHIVQMAWDLVSKKQLPPPPETPSRESDSDSDSDNDQDENEETKDL